MIIRIKQEAPAGCLKQLDEKRGKPVEFDSGFALTMLKLDLDYGYQLVESSDTRIVLDRYNSTYTRVSRLILMGPAPQMQKLVMLAKATKVAATA